MALAASALASTAAIGAAPAGAALPFQADALGPMTDVTADWQHYQPSSAFCIRPDALGFTPGGTAATATGRDPVCRRSGFPATATGLYKVEIRTPILCAGCRRVFIDFSKIPAGGARGHAYYKLASVNLSYTVDPLAHSPNTKNFTNDKFLTPDGSLQQPIISLFDLHAIAYVADTVHFIHNELQGPYYVGPWYLNRAGQRIDGMYLDMDVVDASRLGIPQLDAIAYIDGFNSGRLCPSDADILYVGCVDAWSFSASSINP